MRPPAATGYEPAREAFFAALSGVSGDMTVGVLFDLGLPLGELQAALAGLGLHDLRVTAERREVGGLTATQFVVTAGEAPGETTTLGVRCHPVSRLELARRSEEVATQQGRIAITVAGGDGTPELVAPEYESCRAVAERTGVPLRVVYEAARAAARRA